MSKYIDLAEKLARMHDLRPGTIRVALGLLDKFAAEHPDQMPGRTIMESEFEPLRGIMVWRDGSPALKIEHHLNPTVVPDPEPTNAGHDRDWWVENANVNDAEDCEACEGDLCPVHHGMAVGIKLMARKIAALGADPEMFALIPDPVNTPGGDDE